ncbi:MAG: hypothetical protein PHX08_05890 [Lachnospiraceae bacterium]|nr:hypothetical protein [Lachnospiraceae bacterium]
MRLQDQFVEFVDDIITKKGKFYKMTTTEIRYEFEIRYNRNPASVLPSDYCYNRENGNSEMKQPRLFEYLNRNQYCLLGEGFPYSGLIYHKPKGKEERIIGE